MWYSSDNYNVSECTLLLRFICFRKHVSILSLHTVTAFISDGFHFEHLSSMLSPQHAELSSGLENDARKSPRTRLPDR